MYSKYATNKWLIEPLPQRLGFVCWANGFGAAEERGKLLGVHSGFISGMEEFEDV